MAVAGPGIADVLGGHVPGVGQLLGDQQDPRVDRLHLLADLAQELPAAAAAAQADVAVVRVVDRPGEVEAEAVDVELAGQVDDVLDEEVPGHVVVEVDHRSPDGVAVVVGAMGDVVLGDLPQDVVAAAAVVEHQIEDDRDAVAMRGVDQLLELVGRAVGGFDGVEERRVVAPADVAGELVDRQQLNGRDAELR